MLRFMDRVRVKVNPATKIITPGQQHALLFAGHTGYVIGQKKDLSYAVWFNDCQGFPEPIVEALREDELEFVENHIPLLKEEDLENI